MKERQSDKQKEPVDQKLEADLQQAGPQGNQGMYGLGQYDAAGNPDPHGQQAQQLAPDETGTRSEEEARKLAEYDKEEREHQVARGHTGKQLNTGEHS